MSVMFLSVVCFHKHFRARLLWNEKKMLQVIYLGFPGLKRLRVAPSNSSSKMHFNGVLKAQRPLPPPFPKSTAVLCSSPVAGGFTKSMSWVSFTKTMFFPSRPITVRLPRPTALRGVLKPPPPPPPHPHQHHPYEHTHPPQPPNHDPVWWGIRG